MLAARCAPPAAVVAASRPVAAAAQPRQRLAWRWGGGSSSSSSSANSAVPSSGLRWQLQQHSKPHRLPPLLAAADSSGPEGGPAGDAAADELPLWRFLRQQGFSADSLSRMQAATRMSKNGRRYASVSGRQMAEEKVQRDLAPNIAALQSEGRDTASMERIFEQFPLLLTTTHKTFASALAALQRLAALLPGDPRAVQAPPGATQLGVVLWLYPTTSALLLRRANLGSLIDGNLRLRRRLGISDADTAAGLFKHYAALVTNFERAEAMVAHLQRLQASGALSAEHVAGLALTAALKLTPPEFDRRWQEGRLSDANMGDLNNITLKDPAGRQRAAAEALGELLQAADGVPGPLQPQYRQQGEALVKRSAALWRAASSALHANWSSLQQLSLSSSQIAAAVQKQPNLVAYNWDGEAKQRQLAWVQQELGLSPFDFITRHTRAATRGVATLAMRADFLRQQRPAVWEQLLSNGTRPLLRLLGEKKPFCARAGCTAAELDAFNRAWLATPAGRRWGAKPRVVARKTA